MTEWYARFSEQLEIGPMTHEAVVGEIEAGRIKQDTELRHGPEGIWAPAGSFRRLHEYFAESPPPLPNMPSTPPATAAGAAPAPKAATAPAQSSAPASTSAYLDLGATAHPHPWHRYWARFVDIFVFAFAFGIFLAFTGTPDIASNDTVSTIMMLVIWVPIAAFLLATSGTTPGKRMFNIRVKTESGDNPAFGTALAREIHVLVAGTALGIPLIALFTQLYQYNQLKTLGSVAWDRNNDLEVHYGEVSPLAWVGLVVVLFIVIWLIVMTIGA